MHVLRSAKRLDSSFPGSAWAASPSVRGLPPTDAFWRTGTSGWSSSRRIKKSGVTLAEITIAVMIIGILAASAAPIYANSLLQYRVDVAAQRIVQDVTQAQRVARQNNSSRTITFTTSDHSYAISGVSSLDRVSAPYKVSVNQAPYRVGITSLVTAAQPSSQLTSVAILFDRFGMPDQGISVTISAGAFQKRVDVAPTSGRVSVQ